MVMLRNQCARINVFWSGRNILLRETVDLSMVGFFLKSDGGVYVGEDVSLNMLGFFQEPADVFFVNFRCGHIGFLPGIRGWSLYDGPTRCFIPYDVHAPPKKVWAPFCTLPPFCTPGMLYPL